MREGFELPRRDDRRFTSCVVHLHKGISQQPRLLEPDELLELLATAGDMDRQKRRDRQIGRRAMIAVMTKTGLRVTELCQLRLRAVDVHHGRLTVEQAETDAGRRQVDLTLDVVDELNSWRAECGEVLLDGFVFATANGRARNKDNVRTILSRVVATANEKRRMRDEAPLPPIVPHTLRRTFISLMLEAGAPLHYVMDQVGHEDSKTTLEIYATVPEAAQPPAGQAGLRGAARRERSGRPRRSGRGSREDIAAQRWRREGARSSVGLDGPVVPKSGPETH